MALSAIFAFVIALSATSKVTSPKVEAFPPAIAIVPSVDVISPSPVNAETSTSMVTSSKIEFAGVPPNVIVLFGDVRLPSANTDSLTSKAPVVAFCVKPDPATSLFIVTAFTAPAAISPEAIVPSNILSLVTASAPSSVLPTAPAAISNVTSPNNASESPPTVKSLDVISPSPVIAVPSTSNAPVVAF